MNDSSILLSLPGSCLYRQCLKDWAVLVEDGRDVSLKGRVLLGPGTCLPTCKKATTDTNSEAEAGEARTNTDRGLAIALRPMCARASPYGRT